MSTPDASDLGSDLGPAVGTPSPFPTDPKKIRSRIKSYERKLRKEKETFGCYDDGAGKRFLLGSLYMLMGDLDGALVHYDWYEQEFPDDGAEPYNHLTWALALYRGGRKEDAFHRLYQTMLENLLARGFEKGTSRGLQKGTTSDQRIALPMSACKD